MLQHNRATLAGLGATLAVALLTGCNGSTDASASGSTASPSTAVEASPTEAPATPVDTPTAPVTGSAAPVTATPSTSVVVSRDKKIRLTLPAGWADNTVAIGESATLSARSDRPLNGFSPLLLVSSDQAPGGDLATLAANTGRQRAAQAGGTYAAVPARTIGGVKAPGYQVTATKQGKNLVNREYFVAHGGQLYAVSLTCPADQVPASDQQFEELLKGWAWV